jgi:hypothetical protein
MSSTRDDFLEWCVYVHHALLEVPFKGLSGKRKFKFDAAWPGLMLAVDYQGIGAGHQWAKEQATDHEKINEAQLTGWMFLLVSAESVNSGKAYTYVEQALEASRVWKETQAEPPGDPAILGGEHSEPQPGDQ